MSTFVLDKHLNIIQDYVNRGERKEGLQEIAISFREAGEFTIARLEKGCKKKGHEVLEKSIKAKTLAQLDKTESELATLNKLRGLIGHWKSEFKENGDESTELIGVYLSEHGIKNALKLQQVGINQLQSNSNIAIINDALIEKMDMDLKSASELGQYFLTGDYDIHDILVLGGKTAGSHLINEEDSNEIFVELNKLLLGSGDGKLESEDNFIRHGAQINYPIHMFEHETNESLALPVIRADNNLLMFEKNKCQVISTNAQLKDWYSDHKINIKNTFDDDRLMDAYRMFLSKSDCFRVLKEGLRILTYLFETEKITKESTGFKFNLGTPGASNAAEKFYNTVKSKYNREANGDYIELSDKYWSKIYGNYGEKLKEIYGDKFINELKIIDERDVMDTCKFFIEIMVAREDSRDLLKNFVFKF